MTREIREYNLRSLRVIRKLLLQIRDDCSMHILYRGLPIDLENFLDGIETLINLEYDKATADQKLASEETGEGQNRPKDGDGILPQIPQSLG